MERDVRLSIVQSILQSPHRELDALLPIHVEAENHDPLFYIKLAVWYHKNGTIRDHNKLFAAKSVCSEFLEFRDVGEQLLQRMSVKDFLTTSKFAGNFLGAKSSGKYRRFQRTAKAIASTLEKRAETDNGLQMLRINRFVKAMYRHYHIKPGNDMVAASLRFKSIHSKKYPVFDAIDQIKRNDISEAGICEMISRYKLPPLQVVGSIKELTPAIAAAMLQSMSSTETVNFMKTLERRGLLDNPDFKKLVVKKASKSTKSSSMRSKKAGKTLGKHSDVAEQTTEAFVRSLPMIKKNVFLAIDKSFSMQTAIDIGKEVATILASKVENAIDNLNVAVFDGTVKEIKVPENPTYAMFESQFRFIRANGTTSLGAIIEYIAAHDLSPDVILFITDADETELPFLPEALQEHSAPWMSGLKLINCKVGTPCFDISIPAAFKKAHGIEVENIKYEGDYYALPNLVKLIAAGGMKDLIKEIDQIDPFTYFA